MAKAKKNGRTKDADRLSYADFVTRAVLTLRDESKGKGIIPSQAGGLNDAIKAYYGDVDPKEITQQLANDGVIVIQPRKGFVLVFLPGDEPKGGRSPEKAKKDGQDALKRIFEGY